MRAAVISFTERGREVSLRIRRILEREGIRCRNFARERFCRGEEELEVFAGELSAWSGDRFGDSEALIFVGACGIAVRAVAPWVRDKFRDPAVVAVDEGGRFVIPLLSGHVGGANRLARLLAGSLGAVPVITTATDVSGKFAVDVFAAENGCAISDRRLAKEISAAVLAGERIPLLSDFPLEGEFPREIYVCKKTAAGGKDLTGSAAELEERTGGLRIRITLSDREREGELRLIPRAAVLGMGCRRGVSEEELWRAAERALGEAGVDRRGLRALASVDLKKNEEGLIRLAARLQVPFLTFSAEELNRLPGEYSSSDFVKRTAGVDCVCERAAMAAACLGGGRGRLAAGKRAFGPVTAAVAAAEQTIWAQTIGTGEGRQ